MSVSGHPSAGGQPPASLRRRSSSRRILPSLALLGAGVLVLAACGSGRTDDGAAAADGGSLVVGTTDRVTSIDPAGSYDNGSFMVMNQVYPFLLNYAPGSDELEPDAAERCEFTSDVVYRCTLRDGVTFENGNPLDAETVKYSFDRVVAIDDPNGPASLLANLASVAAPDATTVEFTLKAPNDQTFPQVLASPAGPIVDKEVFPADAVLDDNAVVDGAPFAGPYTIGSHEKNQLISFSGRDGYDGILGEPQSNSVSLRYYASSDNLKLDIQNKAIDVAWRALTPTDVESLEQVDGIEVHHGPGGELRYMVFNLNTMPGDTPEQKLAVRKAIASLVDRNALSEGVYKGTYSPAYSNIPSGVDGSVPAFEEVYGGAPNPEAAAQFLQEAGVATPVPLNLQYSPDHYGPSSSEEYAAVEAQLEATGLFAVDLQSTEWTTYSDERTSDVYPAYQLGWYPDFPDADNYLTPFFMPDNFLGNHFENPEITELIDRQRSETDPATRDEIIAEIQQKMASGHISTLPLLEGQQVAIATSEVSGVETTLDASFKFRFTPISKG
ncbi:peptide ABC transporter substrate-binding protein [Rhodococcus rhodnii]|uniref:ABC peptide transporter n=2 Tax=Rhodococcus rhodnii TaxID=38312 RepID=R7WIY6_9NOCA|nr:ABC transporter substrate-binding protein [Rhodococcus rhodnii]EOM75222.1 ABC peptide transporter [Rhodococcus rhodnii LMG 5362]TXG89243.1 peptide ABC transporter substrate-binding protein [Rhodococcus rhodnii]